MRINRLISNSLTPQVWGCVLRCQLLPAGLSVCPSLSVCLSQPVCPSPGSRARCHSAPGQEGSGHLELILQLGQEGLGEGEEEKQRWGKGCQQAWDFLGAKPGRRHSLRGISSRMETRTGHGPTALQWDEIGESTLTLFIW